MQYCLNCLLLGKYWLIIWIMNHRILNLRTYKDMCWLEWLKKTTKKQSHFKIKYFKILNHLKMLYLWSTSNWGISGAIMKYFCIEMRLNHFFGVQVVSLTLWICYFCPVKQLFQWGVASPIRYGEVKWDHDLAYRWVLPDSRDFLVRNQDWCFIFFHCATF